VFGVGEHHRLDFAVSSPAVVLAAIAQTTKRIRLASAVTVLSAADPVRVFQDFSTVDLISGGRAEITLLFRSEGLRVGVVRNGRAELVPITIGRDFGATVEVVAGLQSTDQVIVNPSDSLASGSQVQVSAAQTGSAK
jgi:hypothetical protein